jgi:dethiobiotin synthetase
LFFAGTDTDVGKTYVASLVAGGLKQSGQRVGVYKPVASGCENHAGQLVAGDAVQLWQAAGRPRTLDDVCPQRFAAPLAPPQSAAAEGKQIDIDLLRRGAECWIDGFDVRIIEGAGGLLSPLADGLLNIDFLQEFAGAKLIIVAANRLGVIHQVLATCEAARHRGVVPTGVILSQTTRDGDESVATNRRGIERYSDIPILGSIAFGAQSWGELSQIARLLGISARLP